MTSVDGEVVFPQEIAVDPVKATRAIFVSLDEGLFASPSMVESFRLVDRAYEANKLARLQFMACSVLPLESEGLDLSFVHDA